MDLKIKFLIPALLACLPAFANQGMDKGPPDLTAVISQMQLNPEQATRLTEMVRQHHEEMQVDRRDKQEFHQKMRSKREQHRYDLLTVLSYEQLFQFDRYMRDQRPRHREQGNRNE